MLKLLGALLLMLGASGLGFGAAAQLRARATVLHGLVASLEQMERELTFRLTPMPELLERLSGEKQAPWELFFARCKCGLLHLGERSLGDIWRSALEEGTDLLLGNEERQIMLELGEVVGRYDGEGQQAALERAVSGLEHCWKRAQTEWDRMGRVYSSLGLGAGAMLVILLL